MRRSTVARYGLALVAVIGVAALVPPGHGQVSYDDLAPTTVFRCPLVGGNTAVSVPLSPIVRFEGLAPASPGGHPMRYRYLFKPAIGLDGASITTAFQYYQAPLDSLLGWGDSGWSPWQDYPSTGQLVELSLDGAIANAYYFLALQVMDHTGAVSLGRRYQQEVGHFVARAGVYYPDVVVSEQFLGSSSATQASYEIAARQPLNFSWTADALAYCGELVSLRHGWDIIDVNDAYDPGWAVPAGLAPTNWYANERMFESGLHTFTVRAVDDQGVARIVVRYLRVVPYVEPMFQLPLLVVDQVVDHNSNAWMSRDGRPLNDEIYRNAWWHFLAEGYGGVADLSWSRDWRDHTASVTYEDIVGYRAVLCYAKAAVSQTMFSTFRPQGETDRYVWLTPYQQGGGNFMLVGEASQASFLEIASNCMIPVIFDTTEETMIIGGNEYRTGFGTREMPGGDTVLRGPLMYPYATAGIAALDWTAPPSRYVYGRTTPASVDRSRLCGGLKGVVLSPEFRARHGVPGAAIADTIFTDPEIDWRDDLAAHVDTLSLLDQQAFIWSEDEFTDGNINGRPTPLVPRTCAGPEYDDVPNDLCVEPMFTGIARIDWMREQEYARGRTDWPQSRYSASQLEAGCGPMILTDHDGRPMSSALTNGQVFGYLSYTTVPHKPNPRADIYWGFDPYRFDHARMRDAVRWALEYFGLQINR